MRFTWMVLACVFCFSRQVFSQDSISKVKLSAAFEMLARQHLYPAYSSKTSQPVLIRQYRRNSTSLPIDFDTVTDNPFRHGAMYMAIKTTATYKNKIRLNADLYGEYRGFSYGTFNKNNNIVLFPVVSVQVNDTIRVGKELFFPEVRIGQFLNERCDEGIMVYNIDVQGSQFRLRHRNSRLAFTIYGDMSNAIGLGVDDFQSISYEHLFHHDSTRVGASWVIAAPADGIAKYYTYFNLFGRITNRRSLSMYAQFSYSRFNKNIFTGLRKFYKEFAAVAGIEHKASFKRFTVSNRAEARYYGAGYNLFHYDAGLRYRNPASNAIDMYANTVGQYLYPLRKFDTPFSQWAVFTEYIGHNVGGVLINGDLNYGLHPKLSIQCSYDFNALWSGLDEIFTGNPREKRTSFFIYPFFKTAIAYSPLKECHFSVFVTNRSMNLDVSYPTVYLNKRLFFGGELVLRM
jgi:hypothetical protein